MWPTTNNPLILKEGKLKGIHLTIPTAWEINACTFSVLDPTELFQDGLTISNTTGNLIQSRMVEITRRRQSRFFYAKNNNQIIAYIETTASGENFVTYDKKMMNMCGAFIIPEYRGTGIYTQSLQFVLNKLQTEGFTRLGVDYDSFNPIAKGFWAEYFTPCTFSIVHII